MLMNMAQEDRDDPGSIEAAIESCTPFLENYRDKMVKLGFDFDLEAYKKHQIESWQDEINSLRQFCHESRNGPIPENGERIYKDDLFVDVEGSG